MRSRRRGPLSPRQRLYVVRRRARHPLSSGTAFFLLWSGVFLWALCCSWGCGKKPFVPPRESGSFNGFFKKESEIRIRPQAGYLLSPMPGIGAVDVEGNIIVVDNYLTRQILIFDRSGTGIGRIGSQGRGEGEYLYPEAIFYDTRSRHIFLYDGDLLRITEYSDRYKPLRSFGLPLYLEALILVNGSRLFCYSSGDASAGGRDNVVYESDLKGDIVNSFSAQSRKLSSAAESKGGGLVFDGVNLFVATPYEYNIKKYSLNGKLLREFGAKPKFYTPMQQEEGRGKGDDLSRRRQFHLRWSHVYGLIRLQPGSIGIIYSEAGEGSFYMDLYDEDFNPLASDLQLPAFLGGAHGFFADGNRLFLIRNDDDNVVIDEYTYMPSKENVRALGG